MTETAFDGNGQNIGDDYVDAEELAQRNPFFGSAATLNEIHEGVELLVVHWNGYAFITPKVRNVTSEPYSGLNSEQFGLLANYDSAGGSGCEYLSGMGVMPRCYGDEKWSGFYVSIVNTAENRYRLVIELLSKRNRRSDESAKAIMAMYPVQFGYLNIE